MFWKWNIANNYDAHEVNIRKIVKAHILPRPSVSSQGYGDDRAPDYLAMAFIESLITPMQVDEAVSKIVESSRKQHVKALLTMGIRQDRTVRATASIWETDSDLRRRLGSAELSLLSGLRLG